MNSKTNILLFCLSLLLVLSFGASYYRFMVAHYYIIEAEVDCDPSSESCFVWHCKGEECTGDPDVDTWYYKFAYRNAGSITFCEDGAECEPFMCAEGETGCSEVICSEETLLAYGLMGTCAQDEISFSDIETESE